MLYLTYDIDINSDGMGAQYQRIVAIICICHYYNFTYVHAPIKNMEHVTDPNYLNAIESFFQIANNYANVNSIKYDNIFNENMPSINSLNNYNNNNPNKNILVKIYLPYNISDINPIIYEKSMPILQNILINTYLPFYQNNNNTKIAIHIRRGDVGPNINNDRYSPISDFIRIINSLKQKYSNSSFFIFTQIDENNKNEFDIFNNDKSIQIKANEDQLLTMNHLINADVLIIGKSSFSYLAGYYNKNTVYYFDYLHSPLSSWINENTLQINENFSNFITKKPTFNLFNILVFCIVGYIIYTNKLKIINNDILNRIILCLLFILILKYLLISNEPYEDTTGIYTAIIIEPRKHSAMEFVLTNFTSMLDNRWKFIIFHGNQNEDYINNIINTKLSDERNRIQLVNLNVDNLTTHDYNTLLYDPLFYDNIKTEVFLIFQTDTMICSEYKNTIYDYINKNYDYVGAPWINHKVGNGGLSLRKKSKMLEIIYKCNDRKEHIPTELHNEDSFFSQVCSDLVNINLPSFEEAKEFSIETIYSDKTFGIHKAWIYHTPEQIENINKYCPGLNSLIKLQ